MSIIHLDETALASIKENTRHRYAKVWKDFVDFTEDRGKLATRVPKEEEILAFLGYLREDKSK